MQLEYNLKSSTRELSGLNAEVFKNLRPLSLSEDDLFCLRLSLEEAFINAVKHGNKSDPDKRVRLKVVFSPARVEIEIKDQGSGFDYLHLPSPIAKENLEKLSQRGIFLIKHMVDEVEFLDGGSRIRMVKLIRRTAKGEK